MQSYTEISGSTSLKESRQLLLNNDKTAISNSSGSHAPSDPLVGQTWFDTNNFTNKQWDGSKWIIQANEGHINALKSNVEHISDITTSNEASLAGIKDDIADIRLNALSNSRALYFFTDGMLTIPQGVTAVYVSGCGGGAGGSFLCGGGGGESVFRKKISVSPGDLIQISVGKGGRSSDTACGELTAAQAGGNGGSTEFGAYITLAGGKSATYTDDFMEESMPLPGGNGATSGSYSSLVRTDCWHGGRGGDSLFGTGGSGGAFAISDTTHAKYMNATDGIGYGSGGGGCGYCKNSVDGFYVTASGSGANGIIIVEMAES